MSQIFRCTLCGQYSDGPTGVHFVRCRRCTGAIMLPESRINWRAALYAVAIGVIFLSMWWRQ